ncbi:MAG: ABC transporter ATP-binding protein [Thermoplasmata archaeon]|nr:ABC transporter ATP-binding protein [Thermoplasmata archaeon]
MAVIETNGLSKVFGDLRALDKVNLEVNEGSFLGLFGPNGAGKTTLLKILTGQLLPTNGKAKVDGKDVVKDPMGVKRSVGIVPEVESPPSYLTAHEYLYFVSKIRGVNDVEKRIERWLKFFGMEDSEGKICRDLSKGGRQKLMLASAFIHEPKILFLDEPFINLDPIYQRKCKDYLLEYSTNGRTVFMCSHLLEIAEKLCNNVAVIDNGKIVAFGSLEEVRGESRDLESAFLKLVETGR